MMNDIIPCCETCRNSCGSGDNIYCNNLICSVDRYHGCLLYEPKEENSNGNT